jgi:hypothetical protein
VLVDTYCLLLLLLAAEHSVFSSSCRQCSFTPPSDCPAGTLKANACHPLLLLLQLLLGIVAQREH